MPRLIIGIVEGIEGTATVVHADGSVDTLQGGDRVFADDAISTHHNTLVNIKFYDGSNLNIGPQFTAILSKEIFDPNGTGLTAEIAPAEQISHIGTVVTADGDTTVTRADGVAHELGEGDFLYTNDIIKVGADGHARIQLLDGSYMSFGPESMAHLNDDLFPSRYPDFVSSGITDAATIRAAILAGQDPADVTRPPAAGEAGENEDVGNSFVVLDRTGRSITPESGHETTGPTETFGDIIEEFHPTPIGGDSVISIASVDGVGAAVIEGGSLVFSVTLDKPNPAASVSATWTLNPGSADSADFPPGTVFTGTVTIPAGATTATIEIPTLDDALFEGGPGTFEDATLALSDIANALPGIVTASGIIEDNDEPPTVIITGDGELADAEVVEGNPLVFKLTLSNPSDQTITLDLAATDGSATGGGVDYNDTGFEVFDSVSDTWVAAGGTDGTEVGFAPGQTELRVRLTTTDDTIDEPDETLTLGIEDVVAGDVGDTSDTATGTILDNDILVTDNLFGQVTEAALFDGPGGNDDGSQDDPAQPVVNTVESGTLTFAGGELTGVSFASGPAGEGVTDVSNADQFILEAREGATVIWRLTVDRMEGITPGGQIGDYNFTLFDNIEHPKSNLAFGDDVLQVQFSYTITSPGGSDTGSLTINTRDDLPDAVEVVADVGDEPIVTNLVVVLDRSGSMNLHPNNDTSLPTRLELAKEAIADLLTAWNELGNANVMVVDFASSAAHATDGPTDDPWLTVDQANTYVQGITAISTTNYQLAAEEVISLFPGGSDPGAGIPPAADQSYVYWLTDGLPNRGNLNEGDWTDFLAAENFSAAYAVGVGGDISATDADLQEVAWPNDTAFSAVNPDGNLVIVDDARDLSDTLLSTVVNRVEGNILDDAMPDSTFGADGPGLLVSLTVDGVMYTYDPAGGGSITPDNGDPAITGNMLSVDTPLGGNLIFDFDNGNYSYAVPQVNGVESETFAYSVVDADGDEAVTDNDFIIHVHEVDDVINGAAGADILTGGDGNELIIGRDGNDTLDGSGGSDVIRGGLGSDTLTGGPGADTFIVRALSEGVDTILDYNNAESDVLDISDMLVGYEPGIDVIDDFVNITADGTVAVNPNPSEPGSSFTDIAVLSNLAPGATVIVQVTEDTTENLTVIA